MRVTVHTPCCWGWLPLCEPRLLQPAAPLLPLAASQAAAYAHAPPPPHTHTAARPRTCSRPVMSFSFSPGQTPKMVPTEKLVSTMEEPVG